MKPLVITSPSIYLSRLAIELQDHYVANLTITNERALVFMWELNHINTHYNVTKINFYLPMLFCNKPVYIVNDYTYTKLLSSP